MGMEIEITDAASAEDQACVKAGLVQFNVNATGVSGRALIGIVREHGAVIAGILGSTWGVASSIDVLWVHEAQRGRGLGTSLLRSAEVEARHRGAAWISVDTFGFQAPDFYRARGYHVVAELEAAPFTPHTQLFLRKQL